MYQHFGAISRELNKKLPSTERNNGRRKRVITNVGRSNAQGVDLGLSESVTLREIVNEARERAMHGRIEQLEKQMETLTPSCTS